MPTSSRPRCVDAIVERLEHADRSELVALWIKAHRTAPPKGTGRRLLELSAAYAVQAKALGGHKPSIRKHLKAYSAGHAAAEKHAVASVRTAIAPGTRLMREWNGRTHHVEVTDQGFLWNGQNWRSLSAIAREITGVRWSGPRFFGL